MLLLALIEKKLILKERESWFQFSSSEGESYEMGQLKAKLCNKYPHILQSINFRGLPRAEQYRDQ